MLYLVVSQVRSTSRWDISETGSILDLPLQPATICSRWSWSSSSGDRALLWGRCILNISKRRIWGNSYHWVVLSGSFRVWTLDLKRSSMWGYYMFLLWRTHNIPYSWILVPCLWHGLYWSFKGGFTIGFVKCLGFCCCLWSGSGRFNGKWTLNRLPVFCRAITMTWLVWVYLFSTRRVYNNIGLNSMRK
jgi:hypothetical protein